MMCCILLSCSLASKNLSCNNAIYAVKSLCDYYVTRGSTVNVVFLDISKAFDKVNHYSFFCKLMNRNTPAEFISVLVNWYSRCSYCVRINMTLSRTFRTMCGVRLGVTCTVCDICKWYNSSVTQNHKLGCYMAICTSGVLCMLIT